MKRAFVDIPEGQVHFRTEGTGEPILLLHQTPMSSSEYMLVIPILAQNYHVIAMDTLGYGHSDKPPRQYRIEDYARSVVSFLDVLGISRLIVAGHHTGAGIAADLAAKFPERVSKLILSACPCFDAEETQAWMRDKFPPIELEKDGGHLMKVWALAKERFPEAALELAQAFVMDFLETGLGKRSVEAFRATWTYDAYSTLPLISHPTLLLCGDKDVIYNHMDRVKNLVPNKKIKIIKGGTAHILRLMPREWAQAVLDYLRGS